MREPLDTDKVMPVVLQREAAAELLANLLPPHLADTIWDDIIAPLYDARVMSVHWQRGACRRCYVPHPALWGKVPGRGIPGRPWPGHRAHCPKYVGPLEHRTVRGHDALFGLMLDCSCGDSYYEYDGEGNRQACPKAGEAWRGPRAEVES